MKKITSRDMIRCSLFSALIAIGAFIQIPIPMMDYFTLQFFFVLMAGLILGSRLGMISVGVYLIIGLMGIPVFAAGGGIGYVLRPSFGYLIGFLLSAYSVGKLSEKADGKFKSYFLSCIVGLIITYLFGMVYKYMILRFYADTPMSMILVFMGAFPLDMPGDFILCILASFVRIKIGKHMSIVKRG